MALDDSDFCLYLNQKTLLNKTVIKLPENVMMDNKRKT
jgi:hypothetical protein